MKEARRVEREGAELRVWGPGVGRSETVGASGKADGARWRVIWNARLRSLALFPQAMGDHL